MHAFNGDVMRRLQVAVDLVNTLRRGDLGVDGRPFRDHGYLPPTTAGDWQQVAMMTADLADLLELVAGRSHAVIPAVNERLRTLRVTPQLEQQDARTALHFHAPDASFAEGWAAGLTAALAIACSTGEAHRIGRCGAPDCDAFFVDRGRNTQRRFCSLQCQNRVKSATYRGRRGRQSPSDRPRSVPPGTSAARRRSASPPAG